MLLASRKSAGSPAAESVTIAIVAEDAKVSPPELLSNSNGVDPISRISLNIFANSGTILA